MSSTKSFRWLLTALLFSAALFGVIATSKAPEPDVSVDGAKIETDADGKTVLRATVENNLDEDVTDVHVTFSIGYPSIGEYETRIDSLSAGDTHSITLSVDEKGDVFVDSVEYDVRRESQNRQSF